MSNETSRRGKPLFWIGSSYEDLLKMPDEVKDVFGYALDLAQRGKRYPSAKPFHIENEPGLIEIVESFSGNAYRAIYTIHYDEAVYVIHCFQKKSISGIKTPQHQVGLIRSRLKRLHELRKDRRNG